LLEAPQHLFAQGCSTSVCLKLLNICLLEAAQHLLLEAAQRLFA
jgi:hypothetical protein